LLPLEVYFDQNSYKSEVYLILVMEKAEYDFYDYIHEKEKID
jgi:hypothetical protein